MLSTTIIIVVVVTYGEGLELPITLLVCTICSTRRCFFFLLWTVKFCPLFSCPFVLYSRFFFFSFCFVFYFIFAGQSFIYVSMFHFVLIKMRCEWFIKEIRTDTGGGMLPIFSSPTTRFQATGVGNLPYAIAHRGASCLPRRLGRFSWGNPL